MRSGKMGSRYRAAVDATLYGTDLPYGYTLTIWGAAAVTKALRGSATVWQAILFVTAASTGYGLLRISSQRASDTRKITLSETTPLNSYGNPAARRDRR